MTPPPSLQDLIDTVRQDAPTDTALDQLVTAAAAVAQLEDTSDALLGHFVDRCRREGRSWSEISAALGVTKQAVHKRFAASIADQLIAATAEEPRHERFTGRAHNALLAAASRAARAGRPAPVGSAHILLALFADPDGIAARVLRAMNLTEQAVASAIEALPAAARAESADAQYTADGKQALRDALTVALELGHNYIGTEHLLLGLYRNANSPAAAILVAAGVTEAEVRARVLEVLREIQQRLRS